MKEEFKTFLVVSICVILIILGLVTWAYLAQKNNNLQDDFKKYQNQLEPFYNYPPIWNNVSNGFISFKPGAILKLEAFNIDSLPPGSSSYIVLYRSQNESGQPTVCSGLIFLPNKTFGNVPIVSFAHATSGMGKECAPSRQMDLFVDMPWIIPMLEKGWALCASDYSGIGTPGTPQYMIGTAGAFDVLNMVRACKNVKPRYISNQFATIGHSQGAFNVLWTNTIVTSYAPELKLVGTVSAAPPTMLNELVSIMYASPGAWVIGPEIAVSWPTVYPNIKPMTDFMSGYAATHYKEIAQLCLEASKQYATLQTIMRNPFFVYDPSKNPEWFVALEQQSPRPFTHADPPLLLMQGEDDLLVPTKCTKEYSKLCHDNHAKIQDFFDPNFGHTNILYDAKNWTMVMNWIQDRFAGLPLIAT
jgi:pimeloyl-ACP methyl ester carboxylesterase